MLKRILVCCAIVARPAHAGTLGVDPGQSIQAAIDAATDGDVVAVSAGTYNENIDLRGKAITVLGAGPESVIRGTGNGPVVTISSGEGRDSVLDSFQITGGVADQGGGIMIRDSSPTIVRNVIFNNRARMQGSGVFVQESQAVLSNNLIVYNATARGDPHSVEVTERRRRSSTIRSFAATATASSCTATRRRW